MNPSADIAIVVRCLASEPMSAGDVAARGFRRYHDSDGARCAQIAISTLRSLALIDGPDHRGRYSLTDAGRARFLPHLRTPQPVAPPPSDLFSVASASQARTAPASAPQPPCNPPAPPVQSAGFAPPAEFARLWSVLETHRGAAAAITAPALGAAAGLWLDQSPANRGTKVREILSAHQDAWPWPICGDAQGYYLAATADELTHASATLRSRGVACLRRAAAVRRAARRVGFEYLGHGRFAAPAHARTA